VEINVCIPTLNRYDLLNKFLDSITKSTVKPDAVYIIDNGNKLKLGNFALNIKVHTPGKNLGVAASWNWFINNVPEIRIIANDDLEFSAATLERLILGYDEDSVCFPNGLDGKVNSFSCFTISDKIVKDVGYFDETLSPNYAYFEDNDYHYRMLSKGYDIKLVLDSLARHSGSSTLKSFSSKEKREHHRKFSIAKNNYIKKWGGEPGREKLKTPRNK
jgi:GT2 family glycosyltransferase